MRTTSMLSSTVFRIVLVGHSNGSVVIANAVQDNSKVQTLVYVDAFVPDTGKTANALLGLYPGSELGPSPVPVALADGAIDMYIRQEQAATVFARDIPEAHAQ